jgi:hypothetical protein
VGDSCIDIKDYRLSDYILALIWLVTKILGHQQKVFHLPYISSHFLRNFWSTPGKDILANSLATSHFLQKPLAKLVWHEMA